MNEEAGPIEMIMTGTAFATKTSSRAISTRDLAL